MVRSEWERMLLTREDIGYGPARQYEAGSAPEEEPRRERRERRRSEEIRESGFGPYHHRLQRRQRPDSWIQADVEEALFLDTWIDAGRITVQVRDGIATLIGMLSDRDEIGKALNDVRKVPGVVSLRNRLEVET